MRKEGIKGSNYRVPERENKMIFAAAKRFEKRKKKKKTVKG